MHHIIPAKDPVGFFDAFYFFQNEGTKPSIFSLRNICWAVLFGTGTTKFC